MSEVPAQGRIYYPRRVHGCINLVRCRVERSSNLTFVYIEAELITHISNNWEEISNSLGIQYGDRTTREAREEALLHLCKQVPTEKIITGITQIIGEHWKEGVCSYINELKIKGINGHLVYDTRDTETIKIYGAVKTTTCLKDAPLHDSLPATKEDIDAYGKKSVLLCCVIGCFVALLLLLIVGSLVTMPVLAFRNPSYSKQFRVIEGDTVILDKIKSLEYSEVTVEEKIESGDSDHFIDAFLIPCRNLTEWFTSTTFISRNLTLTFATYQLGEQPAHTPIYLLPGSNVSYTFRIWSSTYQSKPPFFAIFDSYNAYEAFVSGDGDISRALFHQNLSIGSVQDPKVTKINFPVKKYSYYYMTGYADAGISYQFNVTDNVQYLNATDYVSKYSVCHFSSGITCTFKTSDNFFGTETQQCLVAHIHKPIADDPPSTHIVINVVKGYNLLLVPGVVAVVSISFVIVIVTPVVVSVRRRSKYRRGYASIQ